MLAAESSSARTPPRWHLLQSVACGRLRAGCAALKMTCVSQPQVREELSHLIFTKLVWFSASCLVCARVCVCLAFAHNVYVCDTRYPGFSEEGPWLRGMHHPIFRVPGSDLRFLSRMRLDSALPQLDDFSDFAYSRCCASRCRRACLNQLLKISPPSLKQRTAVQAILPHTRTSCLPYRPSPTTRSLDHHIPLSWKSTGKLPYGLGDNDKGSL